MSLYIDNVIDPVAALSKRELKRIPPHFFKVAVDKVWIDHNKIRNWCWTNLTGRFSMGDYFKKLDIDNKLVYKLTVGFEDQSEAVMFALMLPNIVDDLDFDLL